MNQDKYLNILKREVVLALGCTEPAAVALAAAAASELLCGTVTKLDVQVSTYIFKNGMNVGIPGTDHLIGLPIAAAMGAICGDSAYGLQVFSALSPCQIKQAQSMVSNDLVKIGIASTQEKLYIKATAYSDDHEASCVICRTHTQIISKALDGVVKFEAIPENVKADVIAMPEMSVKEIFDFAMQVSTEKLDVLKQAVAINDGISQEGLIGEYGLKVGKSLLHQQQKGIIGDDLIRDAVLYTAAAADARMAGCTMPVMSTAGSGNQGLTASLPIIAVARRLKISEEQMLRALAISELVTIHAKEYIGRLSVLCGCSICAAIGVCAGLVAMLGGGYEQISRGIASMVADISGLICDGAKPGCALKIATSVNSACQWAMLAMEGAGATDKDGIVCSDVEDTLKNLGILGNDGMGNANGTILQMMLDR